MKKFALVLIILSFLVFLGFELNKSPTYMLLDVMDGDKLFLDLNSNRIKEKDELVKLEGIEIISAKTDPKTLKTLGITVDEAKYIEGAARRYVTAKFLTENLSLKVSSNNNSNYKEKNKSEKQPVTLGTVCFHREDIAVFLLREGFALYDGTKDKAFYKILENPRAIRRNAKHPRNFRSKKLKREFRENALNRGSQRSKSSSTAVFRTSLARTFGDVTIFLINPNANKKPSNSCGTEACRVLLQKINNSTMSIDFALYGLDRQNEILNALAEAKKRGVKIRGVVDAKAGGGYVYADTAKLVSTFGAHADLGGANMHNKFFIFDNEEIFTGTMNISTTGTGGYNANTAILIKNENVVSAYRSEFEQMYEGKFQLAKRVLNVSGLNISGAGGKNIGLDIYFSPVGNPLEKGILPILRGAKKEIFVSIFYLTNRAIIDELIAAKVRGVDVRVIYDAVGANNMKEQVKLLRNSGVKVKVENWSGKDHEKNMAVDGKIFITGSANFSNSGMKKNDENILIFKSPDIAGFYRDYFLKLYMGLDEKYLKFTPRAESLESGNSCYDGLDNNFDGKIDKDDLGCKI